MQKFPYWQKQEKKPLFPDIEWNLPEQRTGAFLVMGGNSQSFSGVVKDAEYLSEHFPVKSVKILLPDSLRTKLPFLEHALFAPATDSGSLATSPLLTEAISASNMVILPGELSRNSATEVAVVEALTRTETPAVLAGDAVDAVTPEVRRLLERGQIQLLASLAQLQKVFRAVYYPKMLLLSMPLIAVVETLHKFTLSYPGVTVVTLHQEQIIVAGQGQVITQVIGETEYTPATIWFSPLVCKLAVYNYFSPGKGVEASAFALLH